MRSTEYSFELNAEFRMANSTKDATKEATKMGTLRVLMMRETTEQPLDAEFEIA